MTLCEEIFAPQHQHQHHHAEWNEQCLTISPGYLGHGGQRCQMTGSKETRQDYYGKENMTNYLTDALKSTHSDAD